jgi:hypothetical protein
MDSPAAKLAQGPVGSAGFIVSRDEPNVQLCIPTSSRWPEIFGWLVLVATLVLPLAYMLFVMVLAWMTLQDDVDLFGLLMAPFFALLFLWMLMGTIRRIRAILRWGRQTRLGVTHGVLWCEPADAPTPAYHWPVEHVWQVRAVPARLWRCFWLEVRSRRRPLVRLQIPCKTPVETEALANILRYAMTSSYPAPPPVAAGGEQVGDVEFARKDNSYSSTLSYFGDPMVRGWVTVGSYPQISQWWTAQLALAKIGIVGRQDSTGDSDAGFDLSVPEPQAELARRWLGRPQEWRDESCCPRCGELGQPMGLLSRLSRVVHKPTSPILFGIGWRYCTTCRQPYVGHG